MKNDEGEEIAAIIYHDNIPHSVFTVSLNSRGNACYSEWDFEWCPLDGVLVYHDAGGGPGLGYLGKYAPRPNPSPPPAAVWLAPLAKLNPINWKTGRKEPAFRCARRLRRMGYRLVKNPILVDGVPNPFQARSARFGPDYVTEYCCVCGCFRSSSYDPPCEHLVWCEDHSSYDGIGADDPCGCAFPKTCGPDCGHSVKEHQAFERGLIDGETGQHINPYYAYQIGASLRPGLILAWDTGHSVGMQNRFKCATAGAERHSDTRINSTAPAVGTTDLLCHYSQ